MDEQDIKAIETLRRSGAMTWPIAEAEQALVDYFADWVRDLDIEVVETREAGITLRFPITPALARVGGIVSGQALMAAADTAMVLAAAAQAGEFQMVATADLHCQFLRPGSGETIEVRAEVVRAGRSLIFVRADLIAQPSGKACATASVTLARS